MNRHCAWLLLGICLLSGAGCAACIQGVGPCGTGCGPCGSGAASYASCKGGCGEVYIDPWVSDPPGVDNCGYGCGGCNQCQECRPILSVLKLLLGTPYTTDCSTSFCAPTCCDTGCDSCAGGHVVHDGEVYHDSHAHSSQMPMEPTPAAPLETKPEAVEPAPMDGARRINPATRRQQVRRASATRR